MQTRNKLASSTLAILLIWMTFVNTQPASSKVATRDSVTSATPAYAPDVILLGVQNGTRITSNTPGSLKQSYKTNSSSLDLLLGSIGDIISIEPIFPFAQASKAASSNSKTIYRLQLKKGSDVLSLIDELATQPGVAFAEPDYIAYTAAFPSNNLEQLTIDDPLYSQQWGMAQINIENAWTSTQGNPAVIIAVIDSGIDLTHPDLQNQLWVNPGEIAGNGIDDDSNGYIDDVNGWNFVFSSNDVWDDNGHGTLVAGVAAATGGNGQGIVGVCPECRIMPVKVMQVSGTANYSDIAAGVLYAAQKGAKVINLSLGGYANSNTLKNAIDAAVNTYGVVVVAGAGNDNLNQSFYPAAYENVLAVAGTAEDDTKLNFSNYGSWVDVSAPAVNIRTTALGGDWANGSGTSIASPFAAGLAALLRTLHPDWNQATIRSQITHTTNNIDSANPTYAGLLGSGRLNAGTAALDPHPLISMSGYSINGLNGGRPVLGATAQLNITLGNEWWNALGVTGSLSTTDSYTTMIDLNSTFGDIPAATSKTNSTAFSFSVDSGAGYNHPIPFTLSITDSTGYSNSFNFTINTETGLVNKSGTLTTDTWTNDKTYIITNNISIPTGNTLTIQPGTVIKFNGNFALSVRGTLIADGTADQPIQFKSNTAGTWDKIFFDDLGIDAVADVDGNYTSGNILRYVNIEGNTGGITCTTDTPYLSHIVLQSSGITCSLGATPIWLLDNTITGNASFAGTGKAFRNKIYGGLTISGAGIVEDNTLNGGGMSLGSGNARRNTITGGGISVSGTGGSIENNSVFGGNVSAGSSFSVLTNIITGSLTTGSDSTVDHNTVSNGISVGSSSTVTWNNAENSSATGLIAGAGVTAQYNRLIGNTTGMIATSGTIEHNLIANNTGVGLRAGAATIRYNTFTGNKGNTIVVQDGTPVTIDYNNIEGNTGAYDLYINIASGVFVTAQHNWWGTTDNLVIAERIFDWNDDDTKATVSYTLKATSPDQTAPGYVRSMTVSPDTTLGIQTGTFQAQFSKPMDMNYAPSTRFDKWVQYNTFNSGLPNNGVRAVTVDTDGSIWVGTSPPGGAAHFIGGVWVVYNTSNSGLPSNTVNAITIEQDGTKWFCTDNGLARLKGTNWTVFNPPIANQLISSVKIDTNGSLWIGTWGSGIASLTNTGWTVYTPANSGLPQEYTVALGIDNNGDKWFGTASAGLVKFDGQNWLVYNTANSDIPSNSVLSMASDIDGSKWIGGGGVARFDGATWTTFNVANSGLPGNQAQVSIDDSGVKWFGTNDMGASQFDGANWTNYSTSNSGLLSNSVSAPAFSLDGAKWFGGFGVSVLYGPYFINDNPQWLSPTQYSSTYDITSAIPKDTYRLNVNDAYDPDGMRIAPFSNATFTVDYAGFISDTTPPVKPTVTADGDGTLTSLSASWISADPESPITQYRYAIGTTPGARDVVAWTYVSSATTSITRTGLNLTYGQPYYITAGARNEGGLWSEDGISSQVVAGVVSPPIVSSIVRANPSPAAASSLDFTVTFSKPVNGVDVGDFTLTSTGVNSASVSTVTGSGLTRTVTVNTGTGNGTIRLNLMDNNSIVDIASNPLGGAGISDGNFTTGEIYTIIKSATFVDVPLNYWANSYIERLYNAHITGGCSTNPFNYCPLNPVTRAQMAIFLLRGMYGSAYTPPAATGTRFTDVPAGSFGAAFIEQLANDGITSGCGGGKFCPNQAVTRAQMAIFLVRAKHGVAFIPPAATGIFSDVPVGAFGANYIEQLVADAITSGCGSGLYCPNTTVKRDSMAVFLVKAFALP